MGQFKNDFLLLRRLIGYKIESTCDISHNRKPVEYRIVNVSS